MFLTFVVMTGMAASIIPDSHPFHWGGHVSAGQSIEIRNTLGSIRAEPAQGDQAEVVTEQSDLKITVTQDEHGLTFRAVHPNDAERDERVDFTVRVPKGVRFIGRTVNGSVEANSLKGDASGYTVNGNVRIRTTGSSEAETVNGSILASIGKTRSGRSLKFSAVNGGITLEMPNCLSARLFAQTLHGAVVANFPVATRSHAAGQSVSGIVGKGGPEVKLVTVNGTIRLRRTRRV